MPACLYNTIFSTLALHRIENRNFELFGSLKAERGHWSSSLDSLHCNRWNFQNWGQVVLSEPLQSGIFPWNGTVLKDAQELFLIPSIKPLPTCFLFIKTPSISSPNVWVLTHLNTWKPSCLLTKRKTASCRIWNICSEDRGEFRPAWLPVAPLDQEFLRVECQTFICTPHGQHWTSNIGSPQWILTGLSSVTKMCDINSML